jgi:hypothetical protein
MAATSSRTEVKEPRRIACRGDDRREALTTLSQDQPVGTKRSVMQGFFASRAFTVACL